MRFAKPDELERVLARPGAVTWLDEHAAREPRVTARGRPLPAALADLVADRAGRCRELPRRGDEI